MDGYKILLIREKGELRALSALCTHNGAPLIKGAYDGGGSIRCPWHGACFNTKTGDVEDFPGLDNLACHKTSRRGGARCCDGKQEGAGERQEVADASGGV